MAGKRRIRKSEQDALHKKGDQAGGVKKRVQALLGAVRPDILMHGGDVEVVKVHAGTVTLRIKGACVHCPFSKITFGKGVETLICSKIPGVRRVRYVS